MSFDTRRLYELLPAIYRVRDAEQGEPLKALLTVIAEQLGVIEENLAQLYDDQFIETCAEWVVPYIGDLIGYRSLHGVVPKVASPRAEVAHTIAFRRRKGTATMLEQLARDVTGWPARVVECFQLLGWTQNMNHLRPESRYAPNLREWETVERLNTPFESTAHTVDVRRIAKGEGKYNIPNIAIALWRLGAYRLTDSPAAPLAPGDTQRFLFDPLGSRHAAFHPAGARGSDHPSGGADQCADADQPARAGAVPGAILWRAEKHLDSRRRYRARSMSAILVTPAAARGRIRRRRGASPSTRCWAGSFLATRRPSLPRATFHYGFSADMSGGEYDRAATLSADLTNVERVPSPHATIQAALSAVQAGGIVEITDSGRYAETPALGIDAGARVELRAANGHRPALLLGGKLEISGGEQSEITINGLLIAGDGLRVGNIPNNQSAPVAAAPLHFGARSAAQLDRRDSRCAGGDRSLHRRRTSNRRRLPGDDQQFHRRCRQ